MDELKKIYDDLKLEIYIGPKDYFLIIKNQKKCFSFNKSDLESLVDLNEGDLNELGFVNKIENIDSELLPYVKMQGISVYNLRHAFGETKRIVGEESKGLVNATQKNL